MIVVIDGYRAQVPSETEKLLDPCTGEIVGEREVPVLPAQPSNMSWAESTSCASEYREFLLVQDLE